MPPTLLMFISLVQWLDLVMCLHLSAREDNSCGFYSKAAICLAKIEVPRTKGAEEKELLISS